MAILSLYFIAIAEELLAQSRRRWQLFTKQQSRKREFFKPFLQKVRFIDKTILKEIRNMEDGYVCRLKLLLFPINNEQIDWLKIF